MKHRISITVSRPWRSAVIMLLLTTAARAGVVVPDPVQPDPSGINKNRYLSIKVPSTSDAQEAILITVVHLQEFSGFDGLQLWAGPTWRAPDENAGTPGSTVAVSPLQCEPYFTAWTDADPLHIYGREIQPEGVYTVQRVDISCPDLSDAACYSAPLLVHGAKFGDMVHPFEGPGVAQQPDAIDMAAAYLKFFARPGAPSKTQAQLQPNSVRPDHAQDLRDLGILHTAVRGESFSAGVYGRPPCACPSSLPCGISCVYDSDCYQLSNRAVCLNGFCVDECLRCSPDASVCGDGVLGVDEQCDDGGTSPGDGCNEWCQLEFTCGNGTVEPGEACDDGATAIGDGCDNYCQLEGLCGNGTNDSGEFCDDGNTADGDGCDSVCRIEPECGNGIVEHLEECDDGNTVSGDGCRADCIGENRSVVMEVVPIPPSNGTNYPTGVVIAGNEIFVTQGGIRLWFELRLSGWGGEGLVAWQATFDNVGFHNGSGVSVDFAQEPCVGGTQHCGDAFGGGGFGNCLNGFCQGGEDDGKTCPDSSGSVYCPGGACHGVCAPAYYDDSQHSEFGLFSEANFSGDRARLSFATFNLFDGPIADPGTTVYGGTLVLDIPPGATGSYTLDFDRRLDATFAAHEVEFGPVYAPIAEFRPAVITVSAGCCLGDTCSGLDPASCLDSGGTPAPACGGDCNGNGRDDACEVLDGSAADCNNNLIPDECDLTSGTSDDCNFDGVPDECQPDTDCNNNLVRDICDIGAGTSDDCNFDLIPDDCQPNADCNGNGVPDLCDIGAGTEPDCNGNLLPDSCDIAGGSSLDNNGDGVPDECCDHLAPIFLGHLKNRYLTLELTPEPGVRSAIRVRFLESASYAGLNGTSLWVGPPHHYPEEDSSRPGLTFVGANLSCTPHYQDWSTIDVLQIFGAEIVPMSTYEVQFINEGCPESFETNYSLAAFTRTGAFGDQWTIFAEAHQTPQPDFNDVAAAVAKFTASGSQCNGGVSDGLACAGPGDCPGGSCDATAPIKALAQLQPNVVLPDRSTNFKDIAATVAAFIGAPYLDTVPDAAPCACPSSVTCGATVCTSDSICAPGFCIDGFCTDKCGRCTP